MSSEPKESPAGSQPERLPFEPGRKKPAKDAKPAEKAPAPPKPKAEKASSQSKPKDDKKAKSSSTPSGKKSRESTTIPDVVSKRMARRMAFFSGIPTSLGMATFVVSYIIVTKGIYKLPNAAVVLVSMGFFGLGVLGLSYGILSASWDETRPGGLIGFQEFGTNFGRLREGWKEARRQKQQKTDS
jgi:hypothetical protein